MTSFPKPLSLGNRTVEAPYGFNRREWIRSICIVCLALPLSGCGEQAPLSISYRQSLLDSAGLVMIVSNIGSKHLSCRMNVSSKVTGRSAQYVFSLAPHGSQEIGAVQAGWSFKSGEKVKITVEGHATHSFTVP